MKCWLALCATLALCSTAAQARDPRTLFMMECQGCHLADGSGGVSSVPSLRDRVGYFLTVPGGREFLAQVPGVARAPLDDTQTTQVLNWLLNEFGPVDIVRQYPPYTVDEISRLRQTPLTEIKQRRAALLQQIEAAYPPSP